MDYVYVLLGLGLLFAGGEALLRGAVEIATRLGVSSLLIGLTVVGFGTSMPELVVSVNAAIDGAAGLAIGNVVGSNISNVLVILGATVLVSPVTVPASGGVRRDAVFMVGACLVMLGASWDGNLTRVIGSAFVIALVAYVVLAYRLEKSEKVDGGTLHEHEAEDKRDLPMSPWLAGLAVIGGLAILVLGAELLVTGAVSIAEGFGVPEAVIGLTLVAIGTSLPELATSLVAAARGHHDVALGNVVGSNIYNVLGILGITALVAPIPVESRFIQIDIPAMIGASALLLVLVYTVPKITRWMGVAGIALYVAYIAMTMS